MNLSVFATGYLRTAAIDIPHLGDCELLRFSDYAFLDALPEALLWRSLCHKDADIPLASLLTSASISSESTGEVANEACLWLVQPVSLQLQRDSFSLLEIAQLTLAEYQEMTQLLNTHFSVDGIRFDVTPSCQYWIMQLPRPVQAKAPLIQAAMQRNIQNFQAEGPDGSTIRQLMNQVQMLLHEHPLNQKRTAMGQLPVNSVWCSGHAVMPAVLQHDYEAIYGKGALYQGILQRMNLTAKPDLATLLESNVSSALVVVDTIDDVDWRACVKATQLANIKELKVYTPLKNGTLKLSLTPIKSWRWWRRVDHIKRVERAMACISK